MRYKQTGLDESTFVNGGVLKQQFSGGRWDDQKLALVRLSQFFVQLHHSSNFNLVYLNNDSYEMTGSSPLLSLCCYN